MNGPLFSIVLRQSAAMRMGEAFWAPLLASRKCELIIDGSGGSAEFSLEKIGARRVDVAPGLPLGELYAKAVSQAEGRYILFPGEHHMFAPGLPAAYEHILREHPDIDVVFSGDTFFYCSSDLPVKRHFFATGRQSHESMRKGLALGIIDRHFLLVATARLREADVRFSEKWEPIILQDLALQCVDAGHRFFYLNRNFYTSDKKVNAVGHTHTLRRKLNVRRMEWLRHTAATPAASPESLHRAVLPEVLLDGLLQGKQFAFSGLVESQETLLMLLYYNSFFSSVRLYDPLDVCRVLGSFAEQNIRLEA